MSHDLAIIGAGFKFLSNSVSPDIRLAMTLKDTWSVARDQSRLGGSGNRFTRKMFSSRRPAGRLQEHRSRNKKRRISPRPSFVSEDVKGKTLASGLVCRYYYSKRLSSSSEKESLWVPMKF